MDTNKVSREEIRIKKRVKNRERGKEAQCQYRHFEAGIRDCGRLREGILLTEVKEGSESLWDLLLQWGLMRFLTRGEQVTMTRLCKSMYQQMYAREMKSLVESAVSPLTSRLVIWRCNGMWQVRQKHRSLEVRNIEGVCSLDMMRGYARTRDFVLETEGPHILRDGDYAVISEFIDDIINGPCVSARTYFYNGHSVPPAKRATLKEITLNRITRVLTLSVVIYRSVKGRTGTPRMVYFCVLPERRLWIIDFHNPTDEMQASARDSLK